MQEKIQELKDLEWIIERLQVEVRRRRNGSLEKAIEKLQDGRLWLIDGMGYFNNECRTKQRQQETN